LRDVLRLSHQTVVYGLGDAAVRFASLLLLPLYTHYLTPSDYGVLVLVGLVGTVAGVLLEMGLRTALFKYYYEDETAEGRRALTGTVLLFVLATSAVLVGAALGLSWLVAAAALAPGVAGLLRLALLATVFDVAGMVPFGVFRAEGRATTYAAVSLARFVISATLNIVAVVVLRAGVLGVMVANLLTAAWSFGVSLFLVRRSIAWTLETERLPVLLRFGLPLVPANLAGWAMAASDRFILEHYQTASMVGIYAANAKVAELLRMATGWFFLAYVPYAFANAKQPAATELLGRMFTYFMLVFAGLALALALLAPEIVRLIAPPEFLVGHQVIPLLLLANLCYAMFYVVALSFDLSGKTQYAVVAVVVGGIANVGLNLTVIPRLGMVGAGLTAFLSTLLLLLAGYVLAQRVYRIQYEFLRLGKLLASGVAIFLLGRVTRLGVPLLDVAASAAWMLGWVVGLRMLGFFTPAEMAAVSRLLASGWSAVIRHAAS
jgi:O-antigen/teichoic acid export membrane protein